MGWGRGCGSDGGGGGGGDKRAFHSRHTRTIGTLLRTSLVRSTVIRGFLSASPSEENTPFARNTKKYKQKRKGDSTEIPLTFVNKYEVTVERVFCFTASRETLWQASRTFQGHRVPSCRFTQHNATSQRAVVEIICLVYPELGCHGSMLSSHQGQGNTLLRWNQIGMSQKENKKTSNGRYSTYLPSLVMPNLIPPNLISGRKTTYRREEIEKRNNNRAVTD